MATLATFRLSTRLARKNASEAAYGMPEGTVVTFKEPTRSLEQNAKLWALLSDVANSKPEDREWNPETWKSAFMHYLGHEVRFCQALDGRGMFPIPYRSSKLSVREMADLITSIQEYGDRHGVQWNERWRYE